MIRDAGLSQNDAAELSLEEESRRRRQRMIALAKARMHWMILAGVILGGLGAAAGYFSVKDKYLSFGRFEVNPFRQTSIYDNGKIVPMWREWLATRLELVRDGEVIRRAQASEEWKRAVVETGMDMSLSQMASSVKVKMPDDALLIDLGFEAPHPLLAQAGVNALMTEFRRAFDEKESQGPSQRFRLLNDQLLKVSGEKTRFERQLRDEFGEDQGAMIEPMYTYLVGLLTRTTSDLATINSELERMQNGGQDLNGLSQEELAALDTQLAALLQRRAVLQYDFDNNSRRGMADSHFQQRNLRAHLDGTDAQIAERVAQLRAGSTSLNGSAMSMQQLQVQKADLERRLAKTQTDVADLARKLGQARELKQKIADAQDEITTINDRLVEIDAQNLLGGKLQSSASGFLPATPSNEKEPVKKAVMFGGAGAMAGAGIIFLIGLLDPRMRRIEDAEMDLPDGRLLGILPTLPADLNDPEQAVLVAHSVHHIRTLLQIGRDQSGNAFSVTSPAAGSGKTSLTIALGLSFSSAGSKTLLIDADIVGGGLTRRMGFVVHPRLGQVLRQMGVITEPQIQDALRVAQSSGARIGEAIVDLGYASQAQVDDALVQQQETSVGILEAASEYRFEECVAPTGIKNLYMLPLGEALPQQAGALSPAALRRLVAQARNQFDVVILDTGPLLGSLEASMAAAEVDSTILIVSRGDAKPAVGRCMTHLKAVRGRLGGVVFNHALQADIARSTYASVTMSQGRHPANTARVTDIDSDTSARFGPLATAVACYAAGGASVRAGPGARPANDGAPYDDAEERRKALASAATGKTNGNGKHGLNGH